MKFSFKNNATPILAACLLTLMAALALGSMHGDSTTMDELAHIPAGYSYIAQKDMRLNPEHPVLLKDLAGLSAWLGSKVQGEHINFPEQAKSWQEDVNGQWDFGREFLYESGNNADMIVFWARLPMILIMLVLGLYVFKWAREIYGDKGGLIALLLYALSPTFLAHGRLVTTDVGAAAAFFIATYYLVKWLKRPSALNIIIAGIVLALALLTKFSLVLLGPLFVCLIFAWVLINALLSSKKKKVFARVARVVGTTALSLLVLGVVAMIVIGPFYLFHVWNYPPERQISDAQFILQSFGRRWLAEPVIWMADKPVIRAYGQFFLGVLMVIQRAVGGNTTYFLGEISAVGWRHYFPVLFLIKVPLALIVLIMIALGTGISKILKKPSLKMQKICQYARAHFSEIALLSFFALYWASTLSSNLNIGVRHILPTFPVIYIFLGGVSAELLKRRYAKYAVALLVFWYALSSASVYPSFLSHFNELAGGPSRGYLYAADSNLDWGQDLKRLTKFVEENNIQTIYVDYFGGDSPQYRLGDKFQSWWGDRNPDELPSGSWLAVSATFLQGGRGRPVEGFDQKTGYYNWLNQYRPVTVIGNSIFVYNVE